MNVLAGAITLLGPLLSLSACALLCIVSVGLPIWKDIFFLSASGGDGTDHVSVLFGIWGICQAASGGKCTTAKLGYNYDLSEVGLTSDQITVLFVSGLSQALVLQPLAAMCALLASVFSVYTTCSASRTGAALMSITAVLATVLALAAFVVDMVLFGIAKRRIVDGGGGEAELGNANWLTLGAVVCLLLASAIAVAGTVGRYRAKKVVHDESYALATSRDQSAEGTWRS